MAGVLALAGVLRLAPAALGRVLDRAGHATPPGALLDLQARAFLEAEQRTGLGPARSLQVRLGQGQAVLAALEASGVPASDARSAAAALSEEVDTVNAPRDSVLDVALASPRTGPGPPRLIGLSLDLGPDGALELSRTAAGTLVLHRTGAEPAEAGSPGLIQAGPPRTVRGAVQGSLYLSMVDAGASLEDAAQALKLLSHRLDLSRDVQTGDRFRMVFDGQASGVLRLIEVSTRSGATRLYGLDRTRAGRLVYVDDQGRALQGGLLRTPVDAARITSGFGFRLHPILGYSRMHQGIDFGAPAGSAVYAAGDGVIEEARWNGGYGRWIRIRHADGWETGYAHLSAFAPGARPGAYVRQGQVVGYVGASGLATGPHLHYEVIRNGAHIDPRTADPEGASRLGPGQIADLEALKARLADSAPGEG